MPTGGTEWNEGRSFHVGMNEVDAEVYQEWLPPLSAAEHDAREMRRLADSMGCSSRLLLSSEATLKAVQDGLAATIERLVPGDFLFISYSGHMTTLTGVGDDADGWDEAWCLHDGILMDDQFHDLLSAVPEGVDVLVVTDSCFAGGLTDGLTRTASISAASRLSPDRGRQQLVGEYVDDPTGSGDFPDLLKRADALVSITARTPEARLGDLAIGRLVRQGVIPRARARPVSQRQPIVARVVALAAAAEGSLAFEGNRQGLFTAALLEILESAGDDVPTYQGLMEDLTSLLRIQSPSLGVLGVTETSILGSVAFERRSADPERASALGDVNTFGVGVNGAAPGRGFRSAPRR